MDDELDAALGGLVRPTPPRAPAPGLVPRNAADEAARAEIERDREVAQGHIGQDIAAAFNSGSNYFWQLAKRVDRERNRPADDPNFDPTARLAAEQDRIPGEYQRQFLYTRSDAEFDMVLEDMNAQIRDMDWLMRRGGVSSFVASALAGIVDIDTPLAFITGGAAMAGKAARWQNIMRAGTAGGAVQAGAATLSSQASTTGDWTDIPAAGLAGMGFGILGGAMMRPRVRSVEQSANDAINRTAREFSETVEDGAPLAQRDIRQEAFVNDDVYGSQRREAAEQAVTEGRVPRAVSVDEVMPDPEYRATPGGSTVGAAQLNPQGNINRVTNQESLQIISDARDWARRSGVPRDYFEDNGQLAFRGAAGDAAARGARRLHDVVVASPLVSDFDRLWRSGSVVAQKLAYDLLENASGIVRNNSSAAMIRDYYERNLLGAFVPDYESGFRGWARSQNVSKWDEIWDGQVRERFNREVLAELNARAYDPPGTPRSVHPEVKRVADAHDRWSELDVEIGKGRPGEGSVRGYEALKSYSGYAQQKWSGARMSRLINKGSVTREQIRDAVAEAYHALHRVPLSDARTWADASIRRSMANERGSDMSLISVLRQDGRGYLEEMLRDAGHSPARIQKLMDRLEGVVAERGAPGHTKGRVDIDLRFKASNGVAIMDLMDTDILRNVSRRARGTSGAAALARKGIRSRADRNAIKEAILQEQSARGQSQKTNVGVAPAQRAKDELDYLLDKDKHLTGEQIDDILSNFDAGPIAGGLSPTFSRIKKLTNLALLNQLGLTQLAETGVQIASVGWDRWSKFAGQEFMSNLRRADSELTKDLKHLGLMVPEERLFRDDLAIDMDRRGQAASEFGQRFDHLLNTGQRIQGFMSGYYHVRRFQQRIAVTTAADKIMTNMKGLRNDLSGARAKDIGLNDQIYAQIKQYVDDGTVEFKEGSLHKLNLDRWDPQVAEQFAFMLNRHTHQVVQKAMIGESSVLFHKDGAASLFFHLKSFPLLAMEKQANRNARIADTQAMTAFIYGMVTAGAAYTARQVINGREDNLTPERIARGSFGLSNLTGWIPMWVDPVASMLGMDHLKFNSYSQGIEANVFSTPAALPTLNRMANIPGAVKNIVTGNMSNDDIRALQATPLIGNAYGFSAIFNAMRN